MKKHLFYPTLMIALLFGACVKDKTLKTYTITRQEYGIKQEVKDAAKLSAPEKLKDLGSFALYNNTMYINEKNKGIHVLDYTNPSSPVNKGFIPIPGNLGLSIKDDILYADCYCDLFVFRIHSKEDIRFQGTVPGTFLSRLGSNMDTNVVQVTVIRKDTTVTQDYYEQNYLYSSDMRAFSTKSGNPMPAGPSGGTSIGSSMAVFAIVNNHLYTVDNFNLNTFSLSDALHPSRVNTQNVSWNVETIFPFKGKLFIGSMTGMFIYSIENPGAPSFVSRFNHARVCDPVIADDSFAYVTLRGGGPCGGFVNQLDVLNIENIANPVLVKSFPFSNPHGLSKDGNVLFVCDGIAGLKVVDATDVNNLVTRQTLAIGKAIDVVALNNIAFVMLDDAIRFYSYDQQFNVQALGTIIKN